LLAFLISVSLSHLFEIFKDGKLVGMIKRRLPYLFQLAELEASRKTAGMQVGSLRENILIALLIYKFGDRNVETQIPITEPEIDVKLFGQPISIKTITGMGGVKAVWTVDAQKAREFVRTYNPKTDTLLAQINWSGVGHLFGIPVAVQKDVFRSMGRERYFKLPKPGTNPRGVEFSKETLMKLTTHNGTKSIEIFWNRSKIEYDPYQRWVDYWKEDNLA